MTKTLKDISMAIIILGTALWVCALIGGGMSSIIYWETIPQTDIRVLKFDLIKYTTKINTNFEGFETLFDPLTKYQVGNFGADIVYDLKLILNALILMLNILLLPLRFIGMLLTTLSSFVGIYPEDQGTIQALSIILGQWQKYIVIPYIPL